MNELIEIGYTKRPHGLKGELKIFVEEAYLEDVLKTSVLLLQLKGQAIPYFVEQLRPAAELILKLEDVNTKEAAQQLVAAPIFLRKVDILPDEERELERDELAYADLEGFTLVDKEKGEIGVIEEILELPQQELAVVQYNGRELLIPLNEHLIVEIDEDDQRLLVDLPEGLLDL